MVQRSLEFDHQDRRNGEDTHCPVDEDGRVVHGGVADWSVNDDRLVIDLSAEAAEVFGVRRFDVRLGIAAGVDVADVLGQLLR
jgi:hypothetical protein